MKHRLILLLGTLLLLAATGLQARGLAFAETMRGYAAWDDELRDLRFDLAVTISDIDAWRANSAHPAAVRGSLRLDGGTAQNISGTLQILAPAPGQDGRVLVYSLQGSGVRFFGAKLVRNDGGFDLIDDVTTLHGQLLPPGAPLPSVADLVYHGLWTSQVQFEWWKPTVVLAFLDSFDTIATPWYEELWVKYLFLDTTFGAVAAEFFWDLL